MNRYLRHLLFVAASIIWLVAAGAGTPKISLSDYNPENPPEPDPTATSHNVTIYANPNIHNPIVYRFDEDTEVSLYGYDQGDYKFVSWSRDGAVVSTERDYSFIMPHYPVSLTINYVYDPHNPSDPDQINTSHKVTVYSNPANVRGPIEYRFEEDIEALLHADDQGDYKFVSWSRDGAVVSTERDYSFIMPHQPVDLTINYKYEPDNVEEPGESNPYRNTTLYGPDALGHRGEKIYSYIELRGERDLSALKFTLGFYPGLTVDCEEATIENDSWKMTVTPQNDKYYVEVTSLENGYIYSNTYFTIPVTIPSDLSASGTFPVTIENATQVTMDGDTYPVRTVDGSINILSDISVDINIEGGDRSMIVGSTEQLYVNVSSWDIVDGSVTWSSSNPEVASIDDSGWITAVSVGTTTVTASVTTIYGTTFSDVITVTVIYDQDITGVEIDSYENRLRIQDSMTLTASVQPSTAEQSVVWSIVEGETFASIEQTDALSVRVTGTGVGTARLYATAGSVSSEAIVEVYEDNIYIEGGNRTMIIGSSEQLNAVVSTDDYQAESMSWLSRYPEVASIDDSGLLTALSVGRTEILVSVLTGYGSVLSDTIFVDVVYESDITGVEIDSYENRLRIQDTMTLTASVQPSTAEQSVVWSIVEGEAYVSIEQTDALSVRVTGTGAGTARLSASAGTVSSEATVEVYEDNVYIEGGNRTLVVGSSLQLNAVVSTDDYQSESMSWVSSNPEVASVDANGLLTALSVGSTEVSVSVITGYGVTLSDAITVNVVYESDITGIEIDSYENRLRIQDSMTLTASVQPSTAEQSVVWSIVEGEAFVSIEQTDALSVRVTGTGVGTARLSASAGTVSSEVTVEVYEDNVYIEGGNRTLVVGSSVQLNAVVSTDDYQAESMSWVSSNPEVASVDANGLLTALSVGSTEVSVSVITGYGVTLTDAIIVDVFSVDVPEPTWSYDGRTLSLSCNAENSEVYYSFDNESFSVAEPEMLLNPDIRMVYAYSLVDNAYESGRVEIPIPCFYNGDRDMYLHESNSMNKALEWCEGIVPVNTLNIFGQIGNLDVELLRSQSGIIGVDLSNAILDGTPTLSGMTSLRWVGLPEMTGGEGMFDNCPNLAAIVWHANDLVPESLFSGIDNPNLLLYVPSFEFAPANIRNVITGSEENYQVGEIVLVDGYPYFAPIEYSAKEISYTRRFTQESGYGETRGYESIMLPFDVQRFTHQYNGECSPFAAGSDDLSFWLYEMGNSVVEASRLNAYTPYLISMPNNDRYYHDDEQLAGNIIFSASSVKVSTTPETSEETWRGAMTTVAKGNGIYALNVGEEYEGNPEGSVWVNNLRDIRPFEAYISMSNPQNVFGIFDFTSIETVLIPDADGIRVWTEGDDIYVVASRDVECGIYDISGAQVRLLSLVSSQVEKVGPLTHGFYVVRVGNSVRKVKI